MIRDEGKAETIYCPSSDCNIVANKDTILHLLQDENVKRKYRYLITNSFVEANRSMAWCPHPGCVNAIFAADKEERTVCCLCLKRFCFSCKRDPHEPLTCELLTKWRKKCDDESETANWFHINTKECPKCRAPIEKNGGCNHITCRNISCKAEFCWMCLGPWSQHGSSWYKCNRFDENDSKEARNAQQKSRAALERYLFYCNRYLAHHKSEKLELKLYAMIEEKRQELEKLDIPQVESQFLKAAVDTLAECRRVLMYTYAFAYYLKKNNQCMIFEANQADMEMTTECLSGYLEQDLADNKDEFQKLKVEVLDKSKYCSARKTVLLQHVYEGYAQGTWEFQE
jgi:ariadne-1